MAALGWQSHQRLDSTVAINSSSERARILVGEGAVFVFGVDGEGSRSGIRLVGYTGAAS